MTDIPLLANLTSSNRADNDALINRIHQADIMELCRAVGENSVDLILADLPYG